MTRLESEIATLKEENERLKAEIQTLSDALKTASNQPKRKKKSKTTEELSNDAVPIKK
jgi:cell division protein FtsB